MATVIERERTTDRPAYVDRGDSGAGWAVALIVIVAVLAVGLFVWARYHGAAAPQSGGSNINVTVPGTSGGGASGGTSGGASGGTGGTVGY